ncbi:tropomyosin-1, isoforms 33/34-like [Amphibalanus amphitrite]|uniref:tropomyosin-1, isoforms 33/34-like n=1 Tax=Amphibalanus amphitrite TaxID=1232801 RepID=UPI001C91B578|nr:tropomyosin-1, isoforms 33/34-like [Amphibalanus amphitrite]
MKRNKVTTFSQISCEPRLQVLMIQKNVCRRVSRCVYVCYVRAGMIEGRESPCSPTGDGGDPFSNSPHRTPAAPPLPAATTAAASRGRWARGRRPRRSSRLRGCPEAAALKSRGGTGGCARPPTSPFRPFTSPPGPPQHSRAAAGGTKLYRPSRCPKCPLPRADPAATTAAPARGGGTRPRTSARPPPATITPAAGRERRRSYGHQAARSASRPVQPPAVRRAAELGPSHHRAGQQPAAAPLETAVPMAAAVQCVTAAGPADLTAPPALHGLGYSRTTCRQPPDPEPAARVSAAAYGRAAASGAGRAEAPHDSSRGSTPSTGGVPSWRQRDRRRARRTTRAHEPPSSPPPPPPGG